MKKKVAALLVVALTSGILLAPSAAYATTTPDPDLPSDGQFFGPDAYADDDFWLNISENEKMNIPNGLSDADTEALLHGDDPKYWMSRKPEGMFPAGMTDPIEIERYIKENPSYYREYREELDAKITAEKKRLADEVRAIEKGKPGRAVRGFMLNQLPTVISAAAPDKADSWKREQLAYQNRYNHSWENIEKTTGIPASTPEGQLITNDYYKNPQTKADYDLRRAEQALKGGTGDKKMKTPATKPSTFQKGAVGASNALAAFFAMPLAFQFGNGVAGMFGFDSEGLVCSSGAEGVGMDLLSLVTGNDCSAFAAGEDFVPNEDLAAGLVGEEICATAPFSYGQSWAGKRVCFKWDTAVDYTYKDTNGNDVYAAGYQCMTTTVDGRPIAPRESLTVETTYTLTQTGKRMRDVGETVNYRDPNADNPPKNKCVGSNSYIFDQDGSGLAGQRVMESYRFFGDPSAVGGVSEADKEVPRTLECVIEGDDGATYRQATDTFIESDVMPAPECPALPDGVAPKNTKVIEKGGPQDHILADQDTTDEYLDWWNTYPECRTGACKLDLWKSGSLGSCFDLDTACATWWTDTQKGTQAGAYECRYGAYKVDLNECAVYSGVFDPLRQTVGSPYADPMTGEWSKGQSSPSKASEAMGGSVQNPAGTRQCFEQGWAQFNPVEWVFTPIKCGYEWAFVPKTTPMKMEAVKAMNSFSGTMPGKYVAMLTGWNLKSPDQSCKGIPIKTNWLQTGSQTNYFLSACPGDMLEPLARPVKIGIGFLTLVAFFVAMSFTISGVINYRGIGGGSEA
jgi:hypothetical protein